MKAVVISMLVVLAMTHFMVQQGEAVTCGQVDSSLAPCMGYLMNGGTPSQACCNGVTNIGKITPTTADRQAACECCKEAVNSNPRISPAAASSLPKLCGVVINIPISKDTNCQSIS